MRVLYFDISGKIYKIGNLADLKNGQIPMCSENHFIREAIMPPVDENEVDCYQSLPLQVRDEPELIHKIAKSFETEYPKMTLNPLWTKRDWVKLKEAV